MTKREKASPETIEKLKVYWKAKEKIMDDFHAKLYGLEKKMSKEMNLKNKAGEVIDLEFFWVDNGIVGIGAVTPEDFPLVQWLELDDEEEGIDYDEEEE